MENAASNDALRSLIAEVEALKRKMGADAAFPPPCFTTMQGKFVNYDSRKSLKVTFPVLKESLNPQAIMQGGFITAAFDNVFGPLSYLAARGPCTTQDILTQFIRGISEGETLEITARVVARGSTSIHLTADAVNSLNKLIATSSTNLLIVRL